MRSSPNVRRHGVHSSIRLVPRLATPRADARNLIEQLTSDGKTASKLAHQNVDGYCGHGYFADLDRLAAKLQAYRSAMKPEADLHAIVRPMPPEQRLGR